MGKKSRIVARETPIRVPKAPPIPQSLMKIKAAFGQPFNLKASRGITGPAVTGYRCVAAWKVIHTDDQILEFFDVCDRIGNVQKMYHGTPARNIEAIAAQGLRKGSHGMFGGGIYMGGVTKAMGYTRGHDVGAHYLLEVEVALGTVKACESAIHSMNLKQLTAEGCHSVGGFAGITASWGGKLRHNEYVVYTPEQVLVNHVFEYQATVGKALPDIQTQGTCELVVEREVVLDKKLRAFKDVLSRKLCTNTAYTKVTVASPKANLKSKDIWVCKSCVEGLKLRVGSKVTIRWGYGRTATEYVVTIKQG